MLEPSVAEPRLEPAPRTDRRRALVFALLAFFVYNANLRGIVTGDSLPARLLPLTLLHAGTFALDELEPVAWPKDYPVYWVRWDRVGHLRSAYPLVTPLVATPVFLPAALYLDWRGWDLGRVDRVSLIFEKLAASLIAAASVALVYLVLRRRVGSGTSTLLTVAYGFGTNTWATSSQALWQHGVGQILVAAALWLITGPATWRRAALLGLVLGLLPANRPPDIILAIGFAVAVPAWARRATPVAALAAAIAPAATLAANLAFFGVPLGGYAAMGAARASFFDGPLLAGVAGLLFSPLAGLFVFAPFFLALPATLSRVPAVDRRLAWALGGAAIAQVLLYGITDWRGGACYGPRFLTDLLPILIWLLAPGVEAFSRRALRVFVVGVAVAMATQAVGVFCYPMGGSHLIDDAWSTRSLVPLVEARGGLAHPVFVDYAVALARGAAQAQERKTP